MPAPVPALEAWRRVGRKQLAELLGVHEDSVTDFARKGMPVVERGGGGREGVYDAVAALAWWRAKRVGSPEAARAQRELAQARLTEQTLAARGRELLPAAAVAAEWAGTLGALRNALLAIPTTDAGRLTRAAVDGGEPAVEALLDAIIRRALEELAGVEVPA